jgi:hypothetical protein
VTLGSQNEIGAGRVAVPRAWCLAAALMLGLAAEGVVAATADEVPEWARDLGLFVFGGPPPGVVEIRVNGEFAAEVVEGTPSSIEVNDMLRAGVNELDLEFRPADASPPAGRRVDIRIARAERVTAFRNAVKDPLVDVVIPAEPSPGPCRETIRFWAGPPPAPPAALENRYWLVVEGGPVSHRVTVTLNDVPVYAAGSGDRLIEVTRFVRKGKNKVTFEAVPTCLVPQSSPPGPLRVVIAAGRQEVDTVTYDGPPLSAFELPAKRGPEPITRAQAFRAK